MGKQSFFVTHILNMFTVKDVTKSSNTYIKPKHFDYVIDKIIENVIG